MPDNDRNNVVAYAVCLALTITMTCFTIILALHAQIVASILVGTLSLLLYVLSLYCAVKALKEKDQNKKYVEINHDVEKNNDIEKNKNLEIKIIEEEIEYGKSLNENKETITFEDNVLFVLKNLSNDENLIMDRINKIKKIFEITDFDDDSMCKSASVFLYEFGMTGQTAMLFSKFVLELYKECKKNRYFNIEEDENFIKIKNRIIK